MFWIVAVKKCIFPREIFLMQIRNGHLGLFTKKQKNKKEEKLMSDPRGLCSQSLSSINTLFVESNTKCAFVNNTMSAKNIFVVWKLGFCAGDHDLKKKTSEDHY